MDSKRMIFGEEMPDKNDPRYKKQYEQETAAGRKFAEKAKFNLLAKKIQLWANEHRVRFLVYVFGFVIILFGINIFNMIRAYKANRATHRTAVEMVDSAMQHRHDHLNNR